MRNGARINDKDSWSYYARVGLDKQFGPLVVGVVGEFGRHGAGFDDSHPNVGLQLLP